MSTISNIKFILSHPLNKDHKLKAFLRFINWQIKSRLNPKQVVHTFTEKSKLFIERGMTGATGNLYCGLHEFNDMGFLLHFLRTDDLFVDVGANVGSYTILASAHSGANSISFEPLPATFQKLMNNIQLNHLSGKVKAHNMALGRQAGELLFTNSLDTMNHVVKDAQEGVISVQVNTLDDILNNGPVPLLIKIDVEGFETEVIKGATKTLHEPGLKAIIIELNGSGARYGYDEQEIHQSLLNVGFSPYTYDPFSRKLTSVDLFGSLNTIYIRDFDFVQDRLKNAEKVKILKQEF